MNATARHSALLMPFLTVNPVSASNLDNRISDEFGDLFRDTLITPVIDVLVAKLRYRFGL